MNGARRGLLALAAGLCAVLPGCTHAPPTIEPVPYVDLPRFMGDWYVIAHIPTRPERNAYNAVESYALASDGRVLATFRFRDGGFDAPIETMHPVGHVRPDTGNAVWGMQFFWPFRSEYVIVGLDEGYSRTIIGRSDRDYAWIMARTPTISDADYRDTLAQLKALGYSLEDLRRVPQRWPPQAAPETVEQAHAPR